MKRKTIPVPVMPGHLRVGIYIRVSTQEQAQEGHSIGVQKEKLSAYCLARGWDVYFIYSDPGFSGSNMDRPALQRMFTDILAGHLDMVLVYKLFAYLALLLKSLFGSFTFEFFSHAKLHKPR